jgi:uncharacterized membrane protein
MFNGFHAMGTVGWVAMALLWIAFLVAIVWFIARLTPPGASDDEESRRLEDPREILDRRLAGGEIDIATHEQLRAKLDPRPLAGRG